MGSSSIAEGEKELLRRLVFAFEKHAFFVISPFDEIQGKECANQQKPRHEKQDALKGRAWLNHLRLFELFLFLCLGGFTLFSALSARSTGAVAVFCCGLAWLGYLLACIGGYSVFVFCLSQLAQKRDVAKSCVSGPASFLDGTGRRRVDPPVLSAQSTIRRSCL